MDIGRLRIDLFAFALGALTLMSLAFLSARNGAALLMSALCLAGLLGARLVGFGNRALVPLAAGLVVILGLIWVIDLPASSRQINVVAHAGGGALIGWALSDYLRARLSWPVWGLAAITALFGLTLVWELGEYVGDRVVGTALEPAASDSLVDIFFGGFGGVITIALARLTSRKPARDGAAR